MEISSYTPCATLIATDGAAVSGTGEMALQVPASYAGLAAQGGYAIDLRGGTACTECSKYGHEAGAVFLAGQLFLEYPLAAGARLQVIVTAGGSVSGLSFSPATFAEPDTTGRMLFTLNPCGHIPGHQPTHFVGYSIDGIHEYVMSLDSHATFTLLSGKAFQQ